MTLEHCSPVLIKSSFSLLQEWAVGSLFGHAAVIVDVCAAVVVLKVIPAVEVELLTVAFATVTETLIFPIFMKGVYLVVVPLTPLVVFDMDVFPDLVVASVVVSQAVVQLPTVELQFPDHV